MHALQTDPLSQYRAQSPPPVLFHYTSMGVLERITDTCQIWASHASFLNDSSEFEHARDFIRDRVLERAKQVDISDLIIKELIPIIDFRPDFEDVFVASFTEDGDSLPQWRGYCATGMGVSIGFDRLALMNCTMEIEHLFPEEAANNPIVYRSLLKCVYTPAEKSRLISESVDGFMNAIQGEHPQLSFHDAGAFLKGIIALCSPLFKHESFKEEREWRLVVQCKGRKSPKRHFRAAQSTLIPFIKLDVGTDRRGSYISKVNVGPSPNAHLAAIGVRKLLEHRDLSTATVENSRLPYRSW